MEDIFFVPDYYRMTGIMASLVPGDDIRPFREDIDELSLTFISPLGSDDHDSRHGLSRLLKQEWRTMMFFRFMIHCGLGYNAQSATTFIERMLGSFFISSI